MSARNLGAVFAACLAVFLIASLPLSVVLSVMPVERWGLGYALAQGTVWQGSVSGLRWRGYSLGDAAFTVSPAKVLTGRLGLDVVLKEGLLQGGGRVTLAPWGRVTLSGVSLSADMARLPITLPISGEAVADLTRVSLSRAGCAAAEGTVRTDALAHHPAGLAWTGPVLAGKIACVDGGLRIPLHGSGDRGAVDIALTIARDGTFGVEVSARTDDNKVLVALAAAGFREADGLMTLKQKGRWMTARAGS